MRGVVQARGLISPPGETTWAEIEWLHRDRVAVPPSALAAANEVNDTSGRRRNKGAPVRKTFVRTDGDQTPPMSRLYQVGGRGGLVAIKIYLALLWRCSSPPYKVTQPARAWATLLGLEDPEGNGVRRITAAIKALQSEKLIKVNFVPGTGNTITLLDESGDGTPYLLPSTEYARSPEGPQRQRNRYFKISPRLWTEGDIQSLKGPGTVMLLILLAERGGEGVPVWFSTEQFPARYRISHKTRSTGTRELIDRGLLAVEREALPDIPDRTFSRRRYRNVYKLINPPVSEKDL
jgi:hypothetical protein